MRSGLDTITKNIKNGTKIQLLERKKKWVNICVITYQNKAGLVATSS